MINYHSPFTVSYYSTVQCFMACLCLMLLCILMCECLYGHLSCNIFCLVKYIRGREKTPYVFAIDFFWMEKNYAWLNQASKISFSLNFYKNSRFISNAVRLCCISKLLCISFMLFAGSSCLGKGCTS